jgi:catechol 2,3-dioxygenase-like lactoylglutathione lyase family enzyme
MTAAHVNHVSISARDLNESVRFYRHLLDAEIIPTPNFGFPVQWLRVGDVQLHLFERVTEAPTYHHMGITVRDFESVYYQAVNDGILDDRNAGYHLFELPNHWVQLYIRDPAGNLIEIDSPDVRRLDPDIAANVKRLADMFPQSDENIAATLDGPPSPNET